MKHNVHTVLHVMIDYTMTIEDAIAKGGYRYADKDITSKNFFSNPPLGKKVEEISLYRFATPTTELRVDTEYIYRLIYEWGLRPANLQELLAIGIAYPRIPLRPNSHSDIHAIGSEWRDAKGRPLVPQMCGHVNEDGFWDARGLSLTFSRGSHTLGDDHLWPIGDDYFACVPV